MTAYKFDFPCALALERHTAVFKGEPKDFLVEEELGFELSGSGEHLCLLVEKTGLNTADVVRALSEITGIKARDIGYAGLKDKQAITRQWFSLKCSEYLELEELAGGKASILQQTRNSKKLRLGSHKGNRFKITLRDIHIPQQLMDSYVTDIAQTGVPNYFGPQRFGKAGDNIVHAEAMFSGSLRRVSRYRKGIYLSAARAYLFNRILARRVDDNSWNKALTGEVMALAGSASVFKADPADTALKGRLAELDIHPTASLWGKGGLASSDVVKELESAIASQYSSLAMGLEQANLKQERRPLRLIPENLGITTAGDRELMVEFSLPKGSYATSVLREMVDAPGL